MLSPEMFHDVVVPALRHVADACHKHDLKLMIYYSQPDWHHSDYLSEHHERYREYVFGQIHELLTNYGKIDGMWFDCLNTKWRHWNTPLLVKMIRTLQPGILINSRWGWGMPGVKHNGDFDNPEQRIGVFKIDRPWETCATMGRGWSWRGGGGLMTPEACIRMLIQCVGSGGNLALDCGPRPDGMIDPPEQANYLAMGRWLKKNGEAVYGTRAGPYKPGPYGVSTRKGNRVFLHIMASFPEGAAAVVSLPALAKKVLRARTLEGEDIAFSSARGRLELDLSKVEAGKIELEIIEFSLGKLLSEIESLMRPRAIEKGIDFGIFVDEKVPDSIRTDPVRLRQALINLISNAIKFTEEGHVHLRVWVEQNNRACFLHFEVEDTGIGIPREKLGVVFESFAQADGSHTRKYGGTGLGLTITKKLAELMGGRVTVSSEVGKGSVFTLVIPAGLKVDSEPGPSKQETKVQPASRRLSGSCRDRAWSNCSSSRRPWL